jgi:hypothetical protein
MANAKPKKRAMRSRRSGVKKLELVKANLSILSKLTALFIIIMLTSCVPVRYVDVYSHHNYYQRHRFETYTVPVLVPGRGVMLQTLPAPRQYRQSRRGKH